MTLPIVYREEVPDEINDALEWYEQQKDGLGQEFLLELQKQLEQIAENPELYAAGYRWVRSALLRRFPYVVYYRLESERIVVIAVQHGRRNPRAWRRRV